MFPQFMRERNLSNVIFVTTTVLKKVIGLSMFYQFMRERNPSNVKFVITGVLKKAV